MSIRLGFMSLFAALLSAADPFAEAMAPAGARWERGDRVAFIGDHRGSPGVLPWMDRLIGPLGGIAPAGSVRAGYAGNELAATLAANYRQLRPSIDWTVAVMMFGAVEAQAPTPVAEAAFRTSLQAVVAEMYEQGVILVMATPMPCGDRKSGNPFDAQLDGYAEAIRATASSHGAVLVDLQREARTWLQQHNPDDKPEGLLSQTLPNRTWGLTEAGHDFVASRIAQAIGQALVAAPLQIQALPSTLIGETEYPIRVRRTTPQAELVIRYALDGKDPDSPAGKLYKEPLRLRKADSLTIAVKEGSRAAVRTQRFSTAAPLRAADRPGNLLPGLRVEVWPGRFDKLPEFQTLAAPPISGFCHAPDASFNADPFAPAIPEEFYAARFQGFIEVPRDGLYAFHLGSDDGSRLLIGDAVVVDNDGNHGFIFKSGEIALKEGRHAITVQYFQGATGRHLQLLYDGPGIRRALIPDTAWSCEAKPKAAKRP